MQSSGGVGDNNMLKDIVFQEILYRDDHKVATAEVMALKEKRSADEAELIRFTKDKDSTVLRQTPTRTIGDTVKKTRTVQPRRRLQGLRGEISPDIVT
jgi:hypothetical protein